MYTNALQAISPIDGRYSAKTESLIPYFSEEALIRYRVQVEIEYFIALVELELPQLQKFDKNLFPSLRNLYLEFSIQDAIKIKETEKITNHDVKAVEYFIKEKFDDLKLQLLPTNCFQGLPQILIRSTIICSTLSMWNGKR